MVKLGEDREGTCDWVLPCDCGVPGALSWRWVLNWYLSGCSFLRALSLSAVFVSGLEFEELSAKLRPQSGNLPWWPLRSQSHLLSSVGPLSLPLPLPPPPQPFPFCLALRGSSSSN